MKALTMATLRVLTLVAVLSVAASPAAADPITITSGALTFVAAESGLLIRLRSDEFTFDGAANMFSFLPWVQCFDGFCRPGGALNLRSELSGSDLPGIATFAGETWRTGDPLGPASMATTWMGLMQISADYALGAALTAPFSFTGRFGFPEGGVSLVGSGTATATFGPWPCCLDIFGDRLRLQSIRYDFGANDVAPTPEPASMVLLGTGLAGIIAARARRRSLR